MQLTTQVVERFKGGQMEIWPNDEECSYCGEIESIVVEDNELRVRFAWLARSAGLPPLPRRWVKTDRRDYTANLMVYSASNIGPGFDGDSRLGLRLIFVNETIVLLPPDSGKLNPSEVEGL